MTFKHMLPYWFIMQPANLGRYIIQSYPLDKVSAMILLLPGTYIEHSHNVSNISRVLPKCCYTITWSTYALWLVNQPTLGFLDAKELQLKFFSNSQLNNITLHGKKSTMNNKYWGFLSLVRQRYLLLTLNLEFLPFSFSLLSFVLYFGSGFLFSFLPWLGPRHRTY